MNDNTAFAVIMIAFFMVIAFIAVNKEEPIAEKIVDGKCIFNVHYSIVETDGLLIAVPSRDKHGEIMTCEEK